MSNSFLCCATYSRNEGDYIEALSTYSGKYKGGNIAIIVSEETGSSPLLTTASPPSQATPLLCLPHCSVHYTDGPPYTLWPSYAPLGFPIITSAHKKQRGVILFGQLLSLKTAATYSPTNAVPSARSGLTSLFGMGRGGTPTL